jgi:hypothetical protein
LGTGTDTLPQGRGDQVDPSSDKHAKNDYLRHQAAALLEHHPSRTAPARCTLNQGHLEVSDIHHVIATCASTAVKDKGTAVGRDYTRTGDRAQDKEHNEPPFAPTRERLIALAKERFQNDPDALANFQHDMGDFEKRMMATSPIEVQRTYTQLARILNGRSAIVSDENRVKLAQQVMHEAAHPDRDISQGMSDTCVAASLESRAYTQSPSAAAKMVADIALTGTFTTADGRTITPTTGIAHPYANDGMDQPGRSFASQIFQVTAMNVYADMLNQSQKPPGHYRYAITPSSDKGVPFEEHIYDDSKHPPGDVPYGGVRDDKNVLESMYYKITGKPDQSVVLSGTNVDSLEDFKNKLSQAARAGQFPLVISVYPNNDPVSSEFEEYKKSPAFQQWQKDHPGVDTYLSWSRHAITIQNYDPRTGRVTYLDPSLSHEPRQTEVATLAQGMGVTLWPDSQDRYYNYQDTFNEADRYKPESNYRYLATLPPNVRQAEFNKLSKMELIPNDELTDAQLSALGLRRR